MTTNLATPIANRTSITAESSPWAWLYRIGGAAALLSVVFFPIQIAVIMINPPPDTVIGWFQLFQAHRLAGLLDLDLLLVADQVLTILMFLALYVVLWRVSRSFMLMGVALGLLSTVLFIASNPACAMLSLSDGYAAAVTDAQRAAFLAAGQATIAGWEGSAFHVSYIIGSIAAIAISAVMMRSGVFGRATAWLGILSNAIALGLYVPVIGRYISVFSVVFLWVWYLLTGLRLFRLARRSTGEA
ncbi:MAG TPA: hypothetical protein VF784_15250 [Anaerolineales bacterium]